MLLKIADFTAILLHIQIFMDDQKNVPQNQHHSLKNQHTEKKGMKVYDNNLNNKLFVNKP